MCALLILQLLLLVVRLGPVNPFNHTSWMAAVFTQTIRPMSVCNRCVIEVFGGDLCCQLVLGIFVGIWVFVIRLGQISFFFSVCGLTFAIQFS